ncbi:hypothetical protein LX32DRAFT_297293 [Colletotrichum zoysiae]|uniref:Uncharacterized protein n=1 Tax=Colletotrichum zoysiae TaxID=1216348 RepID=A0AAD9HNH0_9PEZI|nr:hypothetical protein LX32DRAFT_297293 [Colletotrichum zoysiae]
MDDVWRDENKEHAIYAHDMFVNLGESSVQASKQASKQARQERTGRTDGHRRLPTLRLFFPAPPRPPPPLPSDSRGGPDRSAPHCTASHRTSDCCQTGPGTNIKLGACLGRCLGR